MPWNEHFLPRNKGTRSESHPWNFSEQYSVANPKREAGRALEMKTEKRDADRTKEILTGKEGWRHKT
jgi:hypothetical protein